MPLRPRLHWRLVPRSCVTWTFSSYVHSPRPRPGISISELHSTAKLSIDSTTNHYETLQLTSTATSADIKRQFYALSKKHHPDRNPDDPTSSTRFIAISEAYHILSVTEKRAQYDTHLENERAQSSIWRRGPRDKPQGSYSSASFGSRPASGLNKKRSTFRGPPPSFYKSGGYGQHEAKRAEYAYQSAHSQSEADSADYGGLGGFGPGQQRQGFEVPHFDDLRHKETLDNVNEHISARKKRAAETIRAEEDYVRGGMLVNFMLVSGILVVVGMTVTIFEDSQQIQDTEKRKQNSLVVK